MGATSALANLPVSDYLDELHRRHKENRSGALASYIPELTRVDPDLFGIAFATMDGFIYEAGDTAALFTVQSISKAMIYGLALEDHGRDAVLQKIGVEPSGEAFNSITFDERNNRPFNPMVNAGAIAATALVKGADHAERYDRILTTFNRFVGRELKIDEAVYRSESATGHRNRAIAFLELNSGMIGGDVDEHLDLYFRQCSLLVNTVDLAILAATLANGGLNPVTGQRALSAEHVRSVLSVMNTCGMYDYAGGWQFNVGLPAKSGVGGGISAVLPAHLGIGVFSPRLDAVGNSDRGVKVCEDISRNFRLHLFENRGGGHLPIRRFYRGTEIRSKRVRRQAEVMVLDNEAYAIAVCELQGELSFMEAEQISRRIMDELSSTRFLILDMTRLQRADTIALGLIESTGRLVTERGAAFAVVSVNERLRGLASGYASLDAALEQFENMLLSQVLADDEAPAGPISLGDFALLAAWPEADRATLAQYLSPREFGAGERLIVAASPANELFFLTEGGVDVIVDIGSGQSRRVSMIDAGNVFGELALFGQERRTAHVIANGPGRLLELSAEALGRLEAEQPKLFVALALAVGRSLAERLRRANNEIQVLSR